MLERVLIMVVFRRAGGTSLGLVGVLEVGEKIGCCFEDIEEWAVEGDCLGKPGVLGCWEDGEGLCELSALLLEVDAGSCFERGV